MASVTLRELGQARQDQKRAGICRRQTRTPHQIRSRAHNELPDKELDTNLTMARARLFVDVRQPLPATIDFKAHQWQSDAGAEQVFPAGCRRGSTTARLRSMVCDEKDCRPLFASFGSTRRGGSSGPRHIPSFCSNVFPGRHACVHDDDRSPSSTRRGGAMQSTAGLGGACSQTPHPPHMDHPRH